MPEKEYPQVSFRIAELTAPIQERTNSYNSLGSIAKRDLERYYALLSAELRTVDLSEAEAMLICDAQNGILMESHSMRLLWAGIDDAIALDRLDQKWHVDGGPLVAKLRTLSPAQTYAICDAAERFWVRNGEHPEESNQERVRAVGLAWRTTNDR